MIQHEWFHIGEIAIAHNMSAYPELVGTEVTVISEPERAWLICESTGESGGFHLVYGVRWPDGTVSYQRPNQLRKKKPPGEQLGDWELIPWARPSKKRVPA